MPISIAECLGQRTDVLIPDIVPSVRGGAVVPTCPFSGGPCIKLDHNPPLQPICSVRIHGKQFRGRPFIVCLNRMIPAQARALSPSHIAALTSVAQTVLPGVATDLIGFQRQVGVNLNPGRLILDYVLQTATGSTKPLGPQKVILEVQGGGETNNTGTITRYVDDWIAQSPPTNAFLSQPLDTKYLRQHLGVAAPAAVNVPGIIPNNAWKRQLDQILKKAVLASHFGGAFALVTGDVLYDYMRRSIGVGGAYFSGWEVALIGISEVPATLPGAIPITQVSSAVFMTFADFIAALQNFALPAGISDPFRGVYAMLTNQTFIVR